MDRPVAIGLVGLVVAGIVGYGTADAYDLVPGILTIDPDPPAATSTTAAPPPMPGLAMPHPASLSPRPALDAAPAPQPAAVASALTAALHAPQLGPSVGASVRDALTGTHLLDVDADTPRTPASTMKLLTAAAISEPLGASTTFTTSVVRGSTPDEIVLVAGGDMLLGVGESDPAAVEGRAGLGTLARRTAATLKAAHVSRVTLGVDRSFAAGPDFAPTWDRRDLDPGYVGKVATLGLAKDLVEHGHPAELDPSGSAVRAFVAALAAQGITIAGEPAARTGGGAVIASVASAPAADVLAVALGRSDNALTEGLARIAVVRAHVPLGPAPFAAVAAWVRTRLTALGYDLTGVTTVDTCGLSSGQRVPARLVADVLARGASGKDPALQSVLAGLPVAGLTGTLFDRFDTAGATAAAGLARAKTGTLTGVSALAGTVVDADGRLLVYEIVADGVPATGTDAARAALDRAVSTLASCGCH